MKADSRLLVVDDSEMNRDILARRLGKEGHGIVTAASGRQALDRIKEQEFDVVLLDIEMPEMSGLEVLQQIRQRYSQIELPVVMVTSRSDSDDIVRALDLGANDYITKPIDFAITSARVRTQLSLKRTEDARREGEERYALALAGSNDGIWDWNLRTREIRFSGRWKNSLGYADDEIGSVIEEWFDRIHSEDRARVESDMKACIDGSIPHFENEHRLLHRDSSYRWVLSRGVAVRDHAGIAYRIAGSQTDITTIKIADPLTGLPNRTLFMDRLSRVAEKTKRHPDHLFALLFLDLDQFKLINDSLGHMVGDQLIIAFARRLESELRCTDTTARIAADEHTLARLGGDEFTILLEDLHDPSDALRVAERLGEALKHPFIIGGREIFATASIGVSLSSTGFAQPEDLLRDADTAMYRAKAVRRGSVELFDSKMRASAVARLQLETELRHAAERREFNNWYQLIVNLKSGRIHGFEALVRWQHPSRPLVQPAEFIPIAEETGVIVELGRQVLQEACRQLKEWHILYPSEPPLAVSVNLSRRHLLQPSLMKEVRETLEEVEIHPSCLKLEITESLVMANPDQVKRMLQELKDLGVSIAMDDFGTGYSSLSHLHSLPIDTLKIDGSFVSQIEDNPDKLEIVRTIILLAHNLRLQTIAEGIETIEQMRILRELGCEFGQGHFFSRPLDASAATELLVAEGALCT